MRVEMKKSIREKLKTKRRKEKISSVDLAFSLGVAQGTLSKYESGSIETIDKDLLCRWGSALGFKAHYWPARIILKRRK
tara:strand:+ start:329 stop:565 length:237 start_codon:yes stop_codon:yes gene_type:complete